ncbi:MAG: HDIG domain-containing metalloprotein [Candidatus Eisenbacteria bacterium]
MAAFLRRKKDAGARADRVSLSGEGVEERAVDAVLRTKIILGLAMVAAFLVLLELAFPAAVPGSGIELSTEQIAREEIVAPFDFDVLKPADELEEERNLAAGGVVPVYVLDEGVQAEQRRRLGELLSRIYGIRGGPESTRQKQEMLGQLGVVLSETTRQILTDPASAVVVEDNAREVLNALYERGILRARGTSPSPEQTVMLLNGEDESMVRVRDFLPLDGIEEVVRREADRSLEDRSKAESVRELVSPFIRGNIVFDPYETERRRQEARDAVSDYAGRNLKKDEIILQRGERITQEHVTIVRSMDIKRSELLQLETGPTRFFPSLGRVLEALLLLGSLMLYLSVRRAGMLLDTRCRLLFMVLVVVVMAGAATVRGMPGASEYLVPIAILAMLASMLFDFEVAVISTVFIVLLAGIYTGFGFPFVLVSLVAGVVAAHSVRRVRHREDFYLSGIRVVVAYAAAILIADISNADVGMSTLTRCGWGGLNAIVSMGIVIVALPLFERGFKVTTDITLLELADMNKPLLRKMAMSSPGTYHHSIVVGNLAEAAAKAIGANGLLARVASYYHDIGKLVAPGYFVENQQGLEPDDSKHTGLKPKVSSLVIRAHVKDGVELATKEGLPPPLIDVIREHHGTNVMEFFYNRALEEAENPDDIGKGEYSYPGPRPHSKESAIIALADTIEARIRSIGDAVTPKRIEAEIEEVIENRWHDHQLDDAELTLSDLRKIREAFFRVLAGMYHQRVRYPDQTNGPARDGGADRTSDSAGSAGSVKKKESGGASGGKNAA